jgi:hypothetical protein
MAGIGLHVYFGEQLNRHGTSALAHIGILSAGCPGRPRLGLIRDGAGSDIDLHYRIKRSTNAVMPSFSHTVVSNVQEILLAVTWIKQGLLARAALCCLDR